MSAPETYEVYAIRYATIARKPGENFILGDPHETSSNLDYFIWLVRSDRRLFIVDTGFNAQGAARRGRSFLTPPAEGLARMGIDAAQVEDVIITHLHYDHVGGFEQFPAARFHLQDDEMGYATGRFMTHGFFNHAYEVDEVVAMVRHVYKGRVEFHDGDAQLAPGLSVHRIGGHTKGLQCGLPQAGTILGLCKNYCQQYCYQTAAVRRSRRRRERCHPADSARAESATRSFQVPAATSTRQPEISTIVRS